MTVVDDLLAEHETWIRAQARSFRHRLVAAGYEEDDLVQVGRLALWRASQRFEAARGIQLRTYAGVRVRGAMVDLLRVCAAKTLPRDRLHPLSSEIVAPDADPCEPVRAMRIIHGKKRPASLRRCPECQQAKWLRTDRRLCSIACSNRARFADRDARCAVCGVAFARQNQRNTRCALCRAQRRMPRRRSES